MNWICDFSYRHFFEVIDSVKEKYYFGTISEFPKLMKTKKFILLRHDVDVSLDYALKMAELEYEHGLKATYFVLLHSDYYNALSKSNQYKIKKISNFGHEIGLHYDSTFAKFDDQILDMVIQEAELLGNLIDYKITSIAPHNVSFTSKKIIYDHLNFIDVTDPKILNSVKYISDSVQNWRSGCMCNHIDNESKLIILTHPIWWMKFHNPREEILAKFELNQIETIKELLNETKQSYLSYLEKLKTGEIS